jgi:DNA/RNA-binding domain of Phe-tRNA-synthetase-like protein
MDALTVAPHPLLLLGAFVTRFPSPLGGAPTPDALRALLALDADAPLARSEELRATVRDLLRHGGYKPTGRGKPASEYLVRAAGEGALASINAAVDCCNAVSLHSGLPISVVDLDRARGALRVAIAVEGTRYVYNATGQEIDVGGLLGLEDEAGPCANAVKDAQRTKTDETTVRTLSLVWGCVGFEETVERATAWYRELLEACDAETEPCTLA